MAKHYHRRPTNIKNPTAPTEPLPYSAAQTEISLTTREDLPTAHQTTNSINNNNNIAHPTNPISSTPSVTYGDTIYLDHQRGLSCLPTDMRKMPATEQRRPSYPPSKTNKNGRGKYESKKRGDSAFPRVENAKREDS